MFWKKKERPKPMEDKYFIKCTGIDEFVVGKTGYLHDHYYSKRIYPIDLAKALEGRFFLVDDFNLHVVDRFERMTFKTREEAREFLDKMMSKNREWEQKKKDKMEFIKNNPTEYYPWRTHVLEEET